MNLVFEDFDESDSLHHLFQYLSIVIVPGLSAVTFQRQVHRSFPLPWKMNYRSGIKSNDVKIRAEGYWPNKGTDYNVVSWLFNRVKHF